MYATRCDVSVPCPHVTVTDEDEIACTEPVQVRMVYEASEPDTGYPDRWTVGRVGRCAAGHRPHSDDIQEAASAEAAREN